MTSIKIIVPYFGKLPYNMQLWLEGCRHNPTVNWLVITDDKTEYDYPENVQVTLSSFEEIRRRICSMYGFSIVLDKPYKLCDYKVAYGDIFSEELRGYDFWGYCDLDVLFGNIRKFATEEILKKYCKIGFQGHLTLYRNEPETVQRYKTIVPGIMNYHEIFTTTKACLFDEDISDQLYKALNISVYQETVFGQLCKYNKDFFLEHMPEDDLPNNSNQLFVWEPGKLERIYEKDGKLNRKEFEYIHFFCRPMNIEKVDFANLDRLVIYPNSIEPLTQEVTLDFVKKKAHISAVRFWGAFVYRNRHKITIKKFKELSRALMAKLTG